MWIAEGLVPITLEGLTSIRFLRPGARIPLTRFEQIRWAPRVAQAFDADLALQAFGEPFLPVRRREFVLNQLFLSDLLLKQLDLAFDLDKDSFSRYNGQTGTWSTVSRRELLRLVTDRLIRLTQDFPRQFPPSELNKSTVHNLIWLMEVRGARHIPTARQAVELFFNEAIEPSPGAELTQEASFDGLVTYCRLRKFPWSTRAYFDKASTKRFGETSHCFGENGTLRGRLGWRLKQDVMLSPASEPKSQTNEPDRQPSSSDA